MKQTIYKWLVKPDTFDEVQISGPSNQVALLQRHLANVALILILLVIASMVAAFSVGIAVGAMFA